MVAEPNMERNYAMNRDEEPLPGKCQGMSEADGGHDIMRDVGGGVLRGRASVALPTTGSQTQPFCYHRRRAKRQHDLHSQKMLRRKFSKLHKLNPEQMLLTIIVKGHQKKIECNSGSEYY